MYSQTTLLHVPHLLQPLKPLTMLLSLEEIVIQKIQTSSLTFLVHLFQTKLFIKPFVDIFK